VRIGSAEAASRRMPLKILYIDSGESGWERSCSTNRNSTAGIAAANIEGRLAECLLKRKSFYRSKKLVGHLTAVFWLDALASLGDVKRPLCVNKYGKAIPIRMSSNNHIIVFVHSGLSLRTLQAPITVRSKLVIQRLFTKLLTGYPLFFADGRLNMQKHSFEPPGNYKWSTTGNILVGTEPPSMGNAGLPFELLMHTMKFVETREELQDCSLVSQAWRFAAQGEIFSTITIRSEWECRFWRNKFAESPHLAGFVRNLRLRDPKSHGNDQDKPPQYLAADAAPELLAQLTHARSLSLDSFHLWGPVERELALQFRCLESLELYNVSLQKSPDLLDFILNLPQLAQLTMGRAPGKGIQSTLLDLEATVENGKRLRSLPPRTNVPPRLHFLCLYDVEACLDMLMWLTSEAFDLSQIQELCLFWLCFGDDALEVSLPADYFTALDDFINIVGSHVQTLHL
ncbi:hypothetical protein MPER_04413, partial [Moniliophthora perniciosa FA553]